MSEISLSACLRGAREAIDAEQYDQAVNLTRHVLQHYPACVVAYRLLGEVCLEREQHHEAGELFRRVLSADPEDYLAWFGLAAASEGDERPEEAMHCLERAFDLEPSKPGVRQELMRLYDGSSGGSRPSKLPLTRAALARILARGGLYEQAIGEYQAVLAHTPNRVDLELGLAETLWHHGRRIEAAEACQGILERLPHCLKANLLLGEIWYRAEREAEAQRLLQRAERLDPLNAVAQELLGERSPLEPRDPILPPVGVAPEWKAEPAEEVPPLPAEEVLEAAEEPAEVLPSPLAGEEVLGVALGGAALGLLEEEEEEATLPEGPAEEAVEEVPAWLQGMVIEAEEQETTAEPEEVSVPAPAEEAPEALEEAPPSVVEEEIEEPTAPPVPAEPDLPGWLGEEEEETPAAEVEEAEALTLPDWLLEEEEEAAPAEAPREEIPEAVEPVEEVVEPEPEVPTAAEGVPDWLTELRHKAATEAEVEEVAEAVLEVEVPAAEEVAEEVVEAEVPAAEEVVEEVLEAEVPAAEEVVEAVPEVEVPTAEEVVEEVLEVEVPPAEEVAEEVLEVEVPTVEEVVEEVLEAEVPQVEEVAEEVVEAEVPTAEEVVEEVVEAEVRAAEEVIEAPDVEEVAEPSPALEDLAPEAQSALERLAARPNDYESRLTLARAYVAQGQDEEALSHYQHLVSVDEVLGQVVEDLEAMVVREPGLSQAHQFLGDALMQQGKLNEALEAYRQALQHLH